MDVWCTSIFFIYRASMVNGGGGGGLVFFGWPTVPVPPRFIESRWDSAPRATRYPMGHRVSSDSHKYNILWTGSVQNIYVYIYTNRSTTNKQRLNLRIAKNLSLGRSFTTFYFGTMTTHKGLTDLFFECCSIHTCCRLGPGLFTLQDHNTRVVQTLFVSSGT